MGINWFEGGRRISAMLMWLVTIGGGAYVLFGGPGPTVFFSTDGPTKPLIFTTQPCGEHDGRVTLPQQLGQDNRRVTLCFRGEPNGVPYSYFEIQMPVIGKANSTTPVKMERLDYRWRPAVTEYMDRRARGFVTTPQYGRAGELSLWETRINMGWARAQEAFPIVAGGVFLIWVLSALIGWIVRGFAGIETGADFRKRPAKSS